MSTDPSVAGPMQVAQANMRKPLPKRFYKTASAAPGPAGFVLNLDGKPARTPGRAPLAVADPAVAAALAAEWNAQTTDIDPAAMPLTRIVNSAIDGVAAHLADVRDEIVAYAGSDLLCYRAADPAGLVARQEELWTPILAWARETLGLRFILVAGVTFTEQPPDTLARIATALEPLPALALAAVHVATTLTGSAVLALALARGRLTTVEAWRAAHVDEDWQIALWGADAEATARRANRFREFAAAGLILAASRG